jgi:hypothetical protein
MLTAKTFIEKLDYNTPKKIPDHIFEEVFEILEKNESQWYDLRFDEYGNIVKIIRNNQKQKK